MSRTKPICVECEIELKVERCGVYVAELFQHDEKVYSITMADMHKCPGCGIKIITGFAGRSTEHHQEDLELKVRELIKRGEIVIKSHERLPKRQPEGQPDAMPAL